MKNLFKHATYLSFYIVLIFLIHISLASTVAFFHFELGHRLPDVEDWMLEHQWELLSIAKLSSLFIVFRFLSVKGNFRRPFNDILGLGDEIDYPELLVGLFFLFFITLFIGRPIGNDADFYFLRVSSSFIGNLVFLLSDAFLWFSLNIFYPLEKRKRYFAIFTFPILSLLFIQTFILYGRNVDTITFIHFVMGYLMIFITSLNGKPAWNSVMLYSIIVQCSLNAFFGTDPIWGKLYSPFVLDDGITSTEFSALAVIVLGYFVYKNFMREKRKKQLV